MEAPSQNSESNTQPDSSLRASANISESKSNTQPQSQPDSLRASVKFSESESKANTQKESESKPLRASTKISTVNLAGSKGISAHNHTVIRIHYTTEAEDRITVYGAGEGLSWDEPIEAIHKVEDGEDIWEVIIPVVDPSCVIHFKPMHNDTWAKGNDYLVSAGKTVEIYPFFYTSEGHYFKRHFYSKIMRNRRRIVIYLPPSYDENPYKEYPIMFMMDGHNLFDTEHSFCEKIWKMKPTLDSLCCTNIVEPIIVGVYPIERGNEYLPTYVEEYKEGGQADKYLDFLLKELKPYIQFHTRATDCIGISGSSWGGVISFYAWMTRPDDFDICGSFSPSMKHNNRELFPIAEKAVSARKDHHKIYMDYGTVHDEGKATRDMFSFLEKADVYKPHQHMFTVFEGHEHNEDFWAMRSPEAFEWMYADPTRAPGSYHD